MTNIRSKGDRLYILWPPHDRNIACYWLGDSTERKMTLVEVISGHWAWYYGDRVKVRIVEEGHELEGTTQHVDIKDIDEGKDTLSD